MELFIDNEIENIRKYMNNQNDNIQNDTYEIEHNQINENNNIESFQLPDIVNENNDVVEIEEKFENKKNIDSEIKSYMNNFFPNCFKLLSLHKNT
jgi:hypothetical protein